MNFCSATREHKHDTKWIEEQLVRLKNPLPVPKAEEKDSVSACPRSDDQRLDDIINSGEKLDKSQERVIRSRLIIILYVYEM